MDFKEFFKKYKIELQNPELMQIAFTHSSYSCLLYTSFYEKTHYITEKEKIIEYFKKGRESEFLPKIKKPTDNKILR